MRSGVVGDTVVRVQRQSLCQHVPAPRKLRLGYGARFGGGGKPGEPPTRAHPCLHAAIQLVLAGHASQPTRAHPCLHAAIQPDIRAQQAHTPKVPFPVLHPEAACHL
jgi:hypothetical protein